MNLVTCTKEQIRNIKSHQLDKPTVAAHVRKEGHGIEEAKLLKPTQKFSELTFGKNCLYGSTNL